MKLNLLIKLMDMITEDIYMFTSMDPYIYISHNNNWNIT